MDLGGEEGGGGGGLNIVPLDWKVKKCTIVQGCGDREESRHKFDRQIEKVILWVLAYRAINVEGNQELYPQRSVTCDDDKM